jgi:hypothetical protein
MIFDISEHCGMQPQGGFLAGYPCRQQLHHRGGSLALAQMRSYSRRERDLSRKLADA